MTRIANDLRDYVKSGSLRLWPPYGVEKRLLEIADAIDAEHSRRMEQSRRDMRKAACKYMRSMLNDYQHGVKRPRCPRGCRHAD